MSGTQKTATYIREAWKYWRGAALFELDPPYVHEGQECTGLLIGGWPTHGYHTESNFYKLYKNPEAATKDLGGYVYTSAITNGGYDIAGIVKNLGYELISPYDPDPKAEDSITFSIEPDEIPGNR